MDSRVSKYGSMVLAIWPREKKRENKMKYVNVQVLQVCNYLKMKRVWISNGEMYVDLNIIGNFDLVEGDMVEKEEEAQVGNNKRYSKMLLW